MAFWRVQARLLPMGENPLVNLGFIPYQKQVKGLARVIFCDEPFEPPHLHPIRICGIGRIAPEKSRLHLEC